MIYFLVNNTFHLYNARILAKELSSFDCGLIQVPYSLNPVLTDQCFREISVFQRLPYTFEYLNSLPNKFIPLVIANKRKVKDVEKNLHPGNKDFLFVFTETELLNQIIINLFKKRGAKICLIEDGTASAIFYNLPSDALSRRAIFFKWYIRLFYGIKGFYPYHKNGYYYAMMADSFFSAAFFFLPTTIKRNIPVYTIKKSGIDSLKGLDKNIALFLNEPVYRLYTDFKSYTENLKNIFNNISIHFKKIYFKFHPDEKSNEIQLQIKGILKKYDNVEIIENNQIIEDLIKEYKAKIVISYFSSALKNLLVYGLEPVYIYHLVDFLKNNKLSLQLNIFLNELNYNFANSLSEINPEYKSGLSGMTGKSYSINDVIQFI